METINNVDNYVFGDVEIPLKTSLAYNSEARGNKEIHEVTILVNMAGVKLSDAISKTMSQKAVDFQRSRRAKDSNGVFETREQFDEYCEELGSEVQKHFNDVGRAPTAPITDEEAEAQGEQAFAQMSPEAQQRYLAKLEERLAKQQG